MIPLASCLFVVFCLEVAAFWWMCYVHADWLNMTVNENTFNNPGLGWQPKYSCINPKNNRGHVGYTGPCSRICSSKSGKFKESAPPRGLVQSHLPGLACLVLQLQWKLPPVSFSTTAWILPGFLFGWVFFPWTNKHVETKAWNAGEPQGQVWCSPASILGQPVPLLPTSLKLSVVLKDYLCWPVSQ